MLHHVLRGVLSKFKGCDRVSKLIAHDRGERRRVDCCKEVKSIAIEKPKVRIAKFVCAIWCYFNPFICSTIAAIAAHFAADCTAKAADCVLTRLIKAMTLACSNAVRAAKVVINLLINFNSTAKVESGNGF